MTQKVEQLQEMLEQLAPESGPKIQLATDDIKKHYTALPNQDYIVVNNDNYVVCIGTEEEIKDYINRIFKLKSGSVDLK